MNIQLSPGQSILSSGGPLPLASANQAFTDAFRNELVSVLESTLQKYGINPNGITISVNPASSPGQGRQNIVTPAEATPISITSPAPAPAASATASTTPPPSFDDAYWDKQPAAVKQLRDTTDPTKRSQLAAQLTGQGYDIDVPIMVWGWDPQKVTDLRQSFGYTWVPSAGQAPLPEAPGVTVPGLQAYDPKHAPARSIQVG